MTFGWVVVAVNVGFAVAPPYGPMTVANAVAAAVLAVALVALQERT